MAAKLDRLTIRGFKSIEALEDFRLNDLNVLIGANGSGKSNFIDLFLLLRAMVEGRLQRFVRQHGPADGYFYNGVRHTKLIEADLRFGDNRYCFTLEPTAEGELMIGEERVECVGAGPPRVLASGVMESALAQHGWGDAAAESKNGGGSEETADPSRCVFEALSSWCVYHFHDTSMTAGMRRDAPVLDSGALASDASNVAAFLLRMREEHPQTYQMIRRTLRRIAPYFDDFDLRVRKEQHEEFVRLTWTQRGVDHVFSPGHLSDGTVRFLCLATALAQPEPPATIVLDEPELGLHPEALAVLGGLLRSASHRMQVIVATQSPVLLSEFDYEHVITVDHVAGASTFARLRPDSLSNWLEEFSLGDLWQKGTIRGGVSHG